MLWKLRSARRKGQQINEDALKAWINKKERTIKKNKNDFKAWISKETQKDNILMKMFWMIGLARKRGQQK